MWQSALGRKFGTNVHTDSTNLKYGIFILGWVAGKAPRTCRRSRRRVAKGAAALQRLRARNEHARTATAIPIGSPPGAAVGEVVVPRRRLRALRRDADVAFRRRATSCIRSRVAGSPKALMQNCPCARCVVSDHRSPRADGQSTSTKSSATLSRSTRVAAASTPAAARARRRERIGQDNAPAHLQSPRRADRGEIRDRRHRRHDRGPGSPAQAHRVRPAGRRPAAALAVARNVELVLRLNGRRTRTSARARPSSSSGSNLVFGAAMAARALRWSATARRDRPRARRGAGGAIARRAVRRARRHHRSELQETSPRFVSGSKRRSCSSRTICTKRAPRRHESP